MLSAQQFFLVIAAIGGIGWFSIILLSPFWKKVDHFAFGIVVVLLGFVYSFLNFSHIGEAGGATAFLSYDGVLKVFSNPFLVDAGWAHILAADIFVGIWIKNSAAKAGIPYWLTVLVLLLTIMFAPLGLVVYLLIRWAKTKQYFADILA